MSQSSNSDCHRTALKPSYPTGLTGCDDDGASLPRFPSLPAPATCREFLVEPARKRFLPPLPVRPRSGQLPNRRPQRHARMHQQIVRQRADQRGPRVVRPRDATGRDATRTAGRYRVLLRTGTRAPAWPSFFEELDAGRECGRIVDRLRRMDRHLIPVRDRRLVVPHVVPNGNVQIVRNQTGVMPLGVRNQPIVHRRDRLQEEVGRTLAQQARAPPPRASANPAHRSSTPRRGVFAADRAARRATAP